MKTDQILTDYGLDGLAAILHDNAIEKGFWDGEKDYDKFAAKLALVHSEVTEVLEALRKSKGSEAVVEEMADIIIRLLDVYAALRNEEKIVHSLDDLLHQKIEKNKERPKLHGNRF